MTDIDRTAEAYARVYYAELRRLGLRSWSFDEFFAFCRPFSIEAVRTLSSLEVEPADTAAERCIDTLNDAFRRRFGRSLSGPTRTKIFEIVKRCIIQNNRRQFRVI